MEDFLLPKFCVFCGQKPDTKTKEHIIPQWLIKLTGDPNRKINLGVDTKLLRKKGEFKIRNFSFSSFHFPACKSCNDEYSKLEGQSKKIVERILSKDYLLNFEIDILLDWLDKIRIGLWLSSLLLDREMAPIEPNFHIKTRIGQKDRALFVYEVNDKQKGVQFIGFNAPAFLITPSCFALTINRFYFFNLSFDFLFSKNLGFPYPINQTFNDNDNRLVSEMSGGTKKVKLPIIKLSYANPSMEIYQPIIPTKLIEIQGDTDVYNNNYVKNNCLDFSNGKGSIYFKEAGKLEKLDDDIELSLSDSSRVYNREKLSKQLTKQVLNTQLILTKKIPSTTRLDKERRTEIDSSINSFKSMQKKIIRGL